MDELLVGYRALNEVVEQHMPRSESTKADEWVAAVMWDFPELRLIAVGGDPAIGRPLPAMFLGDSISWMVSLCQAGDLEKVRAFMARMDTDYTAFDPGLRHTFDQLFVGNLPGPGEAGEEIAQSVGPNLRPEFERRHQGMAFGPWFAGLMREFPAIEQIYADHLLDQEGELLSTVLFADVTRWLIDLCEKRELVPARSVVERIGSDYPNLNAGAQDVLHVSFLEAIPRRGKPGSEIADWLGPTLGREYRRWF